jgi:hypothetical protein
LRTLSRKASKATRRRCVDKKYIKFKLLKSCEPTY